MTKKNIIKKLEKIRKEQEFFKGYNLEKAKNTQAGIDMVNYKVNIKYNPNFIEEIVDKNAKIYLKKKNISEEKVLEVLVSDIFLHEIGHRGTRKYKGCPENFQKFSEKFLDPIYKVTKIEDRRKLEYFANAIMDIINNSILKRTSKKEGVTPFIGQILFYKEQGKLSEEVHPKFDKFYEAFVRLNLYLWGDKNDHRLLRNYFTFDPEINKAIQNFLKRTGISDMKTTIRQGSKEIEAKDRKKMREYLMNEDNWEKIATIYAEEFGKFMKDLPRESLFGAGGTGKGVDNGERNTDKGKNRKNEKFPSGDGFGDELNKRENQKKLIANGLKAGKEPGWLTNFEYLVSLYELLASDKIFELEIPKTKSKVYPLIPLSERRFEYGEDSPREIIGINFDKETKSLELIVGKYKYNVVAKVKEKITEKPDLVFGLLDTSSSMLDSMPKGPGLGKVVNPKAPEEQQWCWNSKYHVSLIAYFMAVKRFEELGIKENDAYFVNFSSETVLTRGLKNSLKEALHPQFGGTTINIDKVKNLFLKKNSLVFTISDGEIQNWKELLELVKEASKYNLQVKEEKELYDFVINLIDYAYGGRENDKN